MFQFADPYYFLLLLPLAAVPWAVYRRRVREGLVFSKTSRLPHVGLTWRALAASLLPVLTILGLALGIVALARPQTTFSKARRTADVIAIEMVVDVSDTMKALDMSERTPAGVKMRTRLDAVKEAFTAFIEKRPDDLIGLVTFGGFATTRSPLTVDHAALLHILKGVQVPKPGLDDKGQMVNQEETLTAIGDGLATACARLEKAEPKSRIIVLLTDGLSNAGVIQPKAAMTLARRLGIKVYSIGVGNTSGTAPIKVTNDFGQEVIALVEVAMDEPLLKTIAQTTGGRYFNVRDPRGLADALDDINKLEKTKIEREIYNQYNELFPWFLLPALGLIFLGTSLNMLIARRVL